MFNGILQYSTVKHFAATAANLSQADLQDQTYLAQMQPENNWE